MSPVRQDPYQIEWTASAKRALRRIPEKAAVAAVDLVHGNLAANPQRVGRPLRFDLEGFYSARRGDYRVVYKIDDGAEVVVITAIGHRSDIHRP